MPPPPEVLTPHECAALIAYSHLESWARVAEALGIREQSAKNIARQIHVKLGVTTTTRAVVVALEAGYITLAEVAA